MRHAVDADGRACLAQSRSAATASCNSYTNGSNTIAPGASSVWSCREHAGPDLCWGLAGCRVSQQHGPPLILMPVRQGQPRCPPTRLAHTSPSRGSTPPRQVREHYLARAALVACARQCWPLLFLSCYTYTATPDAPHEAAASTCHAIASARFRVQDAHLLAMLAMILAQRSSRSGEPVPPSTGSAPPSLWFKAQSLRAAICEGHRPELAQRTSFTAPC